MTIPLSCQLSLLVINNKLLLAGSFLTLCLLLSLLLSYRSSKRLSRISHQIYRDLLEEV